LHSFFAQAFEATTGSKGSTIIDELLESLELFYFSSSYLEYLIFTQPSTGRQAALFRRHLVWGDDGVPVCGAHIIRHSTKGILVRQVQFDFFFQPYHFHCNLGMNGSNILLDVLVGDIKV
jgi:hypothetical protein